MKHVRRAIVGMLLVVSAALVLQAEDDGKAQQTETNKPGEIRWLAFDEGLKELKADTLDRHMFIDITAAWCGWCKRMDREAFQDTTVIRLVNDHFIPVKLWSDSKKILDIDGYQISEQNLARTQFKVSGIPVFWFISPDDARIGPLRGYQTTERMAQALEFVKDFSYDTTRAENPKKSKK